MGQASCSVLWGGGWWDEGLGCAGMGGGGHGCRAGRDGGAGTRPKGTRDATPAYPNSHPPHLGPPLGFARHATVGPAARDGPWIKDLKEWVAPDGLMLAGLPVQDLVLLVVQLTRARHLKDEGGGGGDIPGAEQRCFIHDDAPQRIEIPRPEAMHRLEAVCRGGGSRRYVSGRAGETLASRMAGTRSEFLLSSRSQPRCRPSRQPMRWCGCDVKLCAAQEPPTRPQSRRKAVAGMRREPGPPGPGSDHPGSGTQGNGEVPEQLSAGGTQAMLFVHYAPNPWISAWLERGSDGEQT